MNDKDKLRIGDSDRELVSRLLKSAVDEGRLTLPEYDERLQLVYEAKTVGDLGPVTGDLMGAGRGVLEVDEAGGIAPAGGAPRRPARKRSGTPVWVRWMWFGWSVPSLLTSVIWVIALTTGVGTWYPWPLWVAGPLGALCMSVTLMERYMIRPALEEHDQEQEQRRLGEA